jgi:hypothetical protein
VDSYGRWQSFFHASREATFREQSFDPATVNVQCHHEEEIDQLVVMAKAR